MPDDTEPAALEAQLAALRRLGPGGRFKLAVEMSEEARRLSVEAEVRRHPQLDEADARQAVLSRIWGPKLADRVKAAQAQLLAAGDEKRGRRR